MLNYHNATRRKLAVKQQALFNKIVDTINNKAVSIDIEQDSSFDAILEQIGDARIVLLGEASHGSKEFYQARAKISQQLIAKKGFMAIAIEGDMPDAYAIHHYLQGEGTPENWMQPLSHFDRFPRWMWRNASISLFIQWLRTWNDNQSVKHKIGFYGLDLYSLYNSIQAVIKYLEAIDMSSAQKAKERYACFDHMGHDPHNYAFLIQENLKKPCVDEAIKQLKSLQDNADKYLALDGILQQDELFFATQNACLVKNAERYYRTLYDEGRANSWNVRDRHMFDTLCELDNHLEKRTGKKPKILVWAHNSHVGDARATEMSDKKELNLGQLVRETFSNESYLLGFSTYDGSVLAADNWDEEPNIKPINPAMQGSYEELFHAANLDAFFLNLREQGPLYHFLHAQRLLRAIGVIYRPQSERFSHYFFSHLPDQFDGLIHIDRTHALEALP